MQGEMAACRILSPDVFPSYNYLKKLLVTPLWNLHVAT